MIKDTELIVKKYLRSELSKAEFVEQIQEKSATA